MTQPIPPGTPTTQGDVAKVDSYFVRDPVTGGVREVGLEDAQILIHKNDWLPADERTASSISNLHAKQEAAAGASDLGKFGYGVARGVGTPLVDMAYPAGSMIHESLSEDSPWLVGGGEALGMLGSAVAGVGPVALLEEGAAKATAGLAAGNAALRMAARRGAQAGIEGGVYGAMGSVSEAHDTNTPLTAQRFASEVVPGMLFGGVLGAGFGAVESLATRALTSRLAKIDESKLDAIFKSGVDDADAFRIGKEFGDVKDPSLGQQLQALASGGEVSPELVAMANDAGPVGQRLRKELAFGHEELAQAERNVVDIGGDFLVAREEAMKQIQSNLKRGHIADLVGPGEAGPADLEVLVRRHVADAFDGELVQRGSPNLETLDPRAGAMLAQHPEIQAVRRFLNEERAAASAYEREGTVNLAAKGITGERAQGVRDIVRGANEALSDAERAGNVYRGVVYRGMKLDEDEVQKILKSRSEQNGVLKRTPYENDNIWSVSPSREGAEGFAKGKLKPGQRGVLFEIEQQSAVPVNHVPETNTFDEALIGSGKKYRVVSHHIRDDGVMEVKLSEAPIVSARATKEAERAAFVDRVLGHIDDTSREQLERSLGASGNLRERLIAGLAGGQNETLDALKAVMAKSKLTDDALREFGEQGVWASKPLDVINKWKPQIEMLMSAPKGVHDAAGDFKKLIGNLEHHEQGILSGNRANAAAELDDLKKRLAAFAKPGERLAAGDGVAITARGMYEDLRTVLEDPTIWGAKFADKQRKINEVLHRSMGVGNEFDSAFVQQIGTPDPDNPWVSAKVFDSGKVNKALREMSEPKSLEQLTRLREYLDDQKKFFKEVLGFKLGGQAQVRIQGALKQIDSLRDAMDKGVYLNGRARQARALLGFNANGGKMAVRAGIGAVMGGAPGAMAGVAISAALNPGKMLQMRAIAERMAESTNSRVWRGISKLLGLRVGDAAREAAGFVGRAAGKAAPHAGKAGSIVSIMLRERGEEREETYNETVKQIMEARARLPELGSKLDDTMPMLENALPGTKAEMLGQAQRGLDYVIDHMPVQPKMRLYGARAAPLSDYDYENFIRMTMAATDPTSILEMAADGELTPNAVAAAEYSAPEFVAYVRREMVRAITDHGPDSISYDKRISASLVMGTPLDESLEPENIAIQQATHQKRRELAAESKEKRGGSGGGGGETGVNERYSSKSDQIEAGAPPR